MDQRRLNDSSTDRSIDRHTDLLGAFLSLVIWNVLSRRRNEDDLKRSMLVELLRDGVRFRNERK